MNYARVSIIKKGYFLSISILMVRAHMPVIFKQLPVRFLISIAGLLICAEVNAQLNQGARVSRAIFTTAIEEREPVDQVLILSNQHNTIYFFSDLQKLENQKIIHRWEYEGKVVSSKIFKVGGPRWRVYSKQKLPTNKTGTWRVVITTEQGLPLKATIFKYVEGNKKENAILPLR